MTAYEGRLITVTHLMLNQHGRLKKNLKGYVSDKYIDKKGNHIIDLTCWGETLDNRIIQIVAASAKLPSRKG